MIRSIVFDMDGVLVDAADCHYEALNGALALFGHAIGRDEHLLRFNGLATREKLAILSAERGLPLALHGLVNRLKQHFTQEMLPAVAVPVPAHREAMARLRAEGYRIGLASNSVRRTVDMVLERCALAEFVEVSLSNEDVARPKPDPEIYLKAAALLGVPPSDCLVVEDNPNGIAAARAAGAHVMVVQRLADIHIASLHAAIAGAGRAAA
jgi:HAD superfamily hydrolase (TIGR01509 family)